MKPEANQGHPFDGPEQQWDKEHGPAAKIRRQVPHALKPQRGFSTQEVFIRNILIKKQGHER